MLNKRSRRVARHLALASTFVLAGSMHSARAQNTNASLNGTVTDASGASVPGADVTALSIDTGATHSAVASGQGTYTFTALPPGRYTITIKKEGFSTNVQNDLVLTVGEDATLKAVLAVGSTNETISVDAAGDIINSSTAELSEVITERAVKELPLNGRDPSSLVLLAPGTTNVLNTAGVLQTTNSFPTESGASANGGRQGSTYYLLDGVQNMDTYLLLAAPFPNADATQEFRVITNNFDARYGFAPGAVVTIQTKSGQNDLHGGIFEFLRNSALNAGNYFTHSVDPLKRSQFGGYLGGPIKKDKIFFFGNYQETKASTSTGTNTVFTPTAAMLAGDFSAVPQTLGGPFVTIGTLKNQISPTLFSPAAVAIAALVPRGITPATGQVNYAGALQRYTYKEATGRVDYDINKSQRLTVRNFLDLLDQPEQTINGNTLANTLGQTGRIYNELLTHTWTISQNSVNVLSGAWLQNDFYSAAHVTNAAGQPVCLSQFINITDPAGTCYLEGGVQVTNGFGQPYTAPNREDRRTWTINDDFSKSLGQHTITVGGNALHQYANEISAYPANPTIFFNGQYTGFGLADFLLGDASGFRQGAGETQNQSGAVLGIYAQDSWRIEPNLTLTGGVRWEPNLPPTVANGRGAAFIPGQKSTRYPNAPVGLVFPGDAGVTDSLLPRDLNQFGPRIGIAWQPTSLPKTAVHGAFGIFFAPLEYADYNHTADIAPFSPTYSFSGTSSTPIPFCKSLLRRKFRNERDQPISSVRLCGPGSVVFSDFPARRCQRRSCFLTKLQAWDNAKLEPFRRATVRKRLRAALGICW